MSAVTLPAAVCEDWPIDGECLPEATTPEEKAALEAAKDLAVDVLWALSGRQFGVCPALARPCPLQRNPRPSLYGLPSALVAVWSGDNWANVACGCAGGCVSSGPRMVHLPGPVQSIVEVNVEGVIQDPSEYQLEGEILYRVGDSWPFQDLSRPLYEDGTWSVTYMRGIPVPKGLGRLTGLLVNEFYLACTGGKCRLPRTVTEVSRQGVTHRMFDTNAIYASGKTGIPEIDLWLSAVNPHHIMQAPTVV
jgi:hypothetical protein